MTKPDNPPVSETCVAVTFDAPRCAPRTCALMSASDGQYRCDDESYYDDAMLAERTKTDDR